MVDISFVASLDMEGSEYPLGDQFETEASPKAAIPCIPIHVDDRYS